jgi:uncharacterized iron-regulated protein
MYNNALSFQTAANSFNSSPNDNDLASMKQAWLGMRKAYENGESFLIGPIATQNLDPGIDTWPVEQASLDSILASGVTFTSSYIDGLPTSLKGFHPIEYLIFTNTTAQFTQRKRDFLIALTDNVVGIVAQIKSSYVAGSSNDYATILNTAGPANTTYSSRKAAILDLVNSMSGICEEVGGSASDGKINSVYTTMDVNLQESKFSDNSWTDFRNNIIGVKNVYLGVYGSGTAGHSLHEYVSAKNLSLDNTIMNSINTAVNSFNTVSLPFGRSVQLSGGERTQVQNIMNAIDSLQSTLDNKLVPFVNQYITD